MPPYRRKGYKRSYGRSRSTSRRRRPMGGSFMKRAKTRAYANLRTGGLLAIERKFLDTARAAAALQTGVGAAVVSGGPSTWNPPLQSPNQFRSAVGLVWSVSPVALNVIGIGDSGSDRDGRQVINDSIHIRGLLDFGNALDVGTDNAGTTVNVVLVLDTQTNGGTPAGSSVFVNPGDITAQTPAVNGTAPFVNLSNSKRFRILKHIRRTCNPSAMSGNGTISRPQGCWAFSMDVPLKQMKTNYVSDDATQNLTSASIGDNGLFLYAWADVVNNIYISYNSRLRFRG